MRIPTLAIAAALLAVGGAVYAQGLQLLPMSGLNPWTAAHVFIFRYEGTVRLGKRGYEETGLDPKLGHGWGYQEATLKLSIVEELKGRLLQHPGVPFEHTVHAAPFIMGNPANVWRNIDPPGEWKPGTRILVSCDGSSDDARALLAASPPSSFSTTKPHCESFDADEQSFDDARIVVDMELSKAPLVDVLKTARIQVAARGPVFAIYVVARIGMEPITDYVLAPIVDLAASTQIGRGARDPYGSMLGTVFMLSNTSPSMYPAHPTVETRWIRKLFRLVTSPPSPALPDWERDNYARIFLSPTIGLDFWPVSDERKRKDALLGEKPHPYHTADEVFRGAPDERAAAVAWVRNHPDAQWKQPMLGWLTGATTP